MGTQAHTQHEDTSRKRTMECVPFWSANGYNVVRLFLFGDLWWFAFLYRLPLPDVLRL